MCADENRSVFLNKNYKQTWERFQPFYEDGTDSDSYFHAFGWPEGLWKVD
jgi:hypothetical protein